MATEDIASIVENLRQNYVNKRTTYSYEWRMSQLDALEKLMLENTDEFALALREELNHDRVFAKSQILSVIDQIQYFRKNTKSFMKDQRVSPESITSIPCKIHHRVEPKGVVLIISPWNFPVVLVGRYLAASIAAGNATVIKPSEVAPKVSALWRELMPKYLDTDFIQCVEGGVPETTLLLQQRFDHIMYTGSTPVGKIIMSAAAKHLTPVTLELGGKSPCFVDSGIQSNQKNFEMLVDRIVFGKFMNCGQVCLSVDYCLVEESFAEVFTDHVIKRIKQVFGESAEQVQKSKRYHRIINTRHVQRVKGYLDDLSQEYIVHGGVVDEEDRFIEPTVIVNPPDDSKVMQEEIFGPLLIIKTVKDLDEGISLVNSKEHSLTMYIFSNDKKKIEYIKSRTRSGMVAINDCIIHVGETALRFGGVGSSGMGGVNGKFSFDELSQLRPVFETVGPKPSMNTTSDDMEKYLDYMMRPNIVTRFVLSLVIFMANLYAKLF